MPAERGRAWTVIEDGLRVRSFVSGADPVEAAFVVMDSDRAAFHAREAEARLREAESRESALRAAAQAFIAAVEDLSPFAVKPPLSSNRAGAVERWAALHNAKDDLAAALSASGDDPDPESK